MSSFTTAVDQLLELAVAKQTTMNDVHAAMQAAGIAVADASLEEKDEALEKLAACIIDPQVHRLIVGKITLLCGGIVEQGGTPEVAAGNVLGLLAENLDQVNHVTQQIFELADSQDIPIRDEQGQLVDPNGLIRQFMPTIMEQAPAEGAALMALNDICIGAIALLARSKAARRAAAENPDVLVNRSVLFDQLFQSGNRSHLTQLLQVLDDQELLVLHPAQAKGFRVRIAGLLTNFQLHFQLMHHLAAALDSSVTVSDELADFEATQLVGPESPIVTGAFQLWNASALDAAGGLPEPMQSEHWIWNEGIPSDIEVRDSERIILLSDPAYQRTWNAGVSIRGLVPELEVIATLSPQEVTEKLAALSAS
ncbi:MAG: hypothetical protein KDA83_03665 [Planctomycetales bacterium]|nr:hypothetical protein [Planctomycetales bacterium]